MFTTIIFYSVDGIGDEKTVRSENPMTDIMSARQNPDAVKIMSWKSGDCENHITLVRLLSGQWIII